MATNANNVTTGKPKVGGAVFRGPSGTTLPTSAEGTLNSALKDLGYISEDGVKVSTELTSSEIKAWGGDVVCATQSGKSDKISLKLIEALNDEVLKAVHVDANVSGALGTGITVNVNGAEQPECVWVIDQVLRGNTAKRIVVPRGKVTAIGEVSYKDPDAVGYDLTITCLPDSSGNTRYEYIKTSSTTSGGTT